MRGRRNVVRALYLERQVSKQCAPGGGQDAGLIEAAVYVPGWFRREELGLALDQGPSVFWTADNLRQINARNRRVLAEAERPAVLEQTRRSRPTSALEYARRARRVLAKAGVSLRVA
jgi:hypothetical protein